MELTILMPCLNEAGTLPGCIREAHAFLERSGVDGEILIADNGSTDGSPQVAQGLGARVIPVARRGYGAALRGGIQAAYGEYVVMGDCDGSYDLSDLSGFLALLRDGADLVVGDRYALPCEKGAAPFLNRKIGVPFLSWLGRRAGRTDVRDFHCGLRAVRRASFLDLGAEADGMEFASEMILLSAFAGQAIAQTPARLRRDKRGRKPHLRPIRDGARHVAAILRCAARRRSIVQAAPVKESKSQKREGALKPAPMARGER